MKGDVYGGRAFVCVFICMISVLRSRWRISGLGGTDSEGSKACMGVG